MLAALLAGAALPAWPAPFFLTGEPTRAPVNGSVLEMVLLSSVGGRLGAGLFSRVSIGSPGAAIHRAIVHFSTRCARGWTHSTVGQHAVTSAATKKNRGSQASLRDANVSPAFSFRGLKPHGYSHSTAPRPSTCGSEAFPRVRHPVAATVLGLLRRAVQGEYRAWASRQRKARDSTCPAFLEKMSRRIDLVLRYLIGDAARL